MRYALTHIEPAQPAQFNYVALLIFLGIGVRKGRYAKRQRFNR
jgi:hypothetical protein